MKMVDVQLPLVARSWLQQQLVHLPQHLNRRLHGDRCGMDQGSHAQLFYLPTSFDNRS